jgi:anaerobic dimethyl sulfoxide reductase subunit B (iron-sulfur subunit)
MDKQLAFFVDMNACTGCKACQVACKSKNNLPEGVRWRRVLQYEGGEWIEQNGQMVPSDVFTYFVSAACMHCENPICMNVCPTAAITKRSDGIVLINQDLCIGCRYCSWACPYGACQFINELGVMSKCTMCVDLIDKGEKPACVEACPYRALEIGTLDELKAKHGNFMAPAPLPDPSITGPSVVYSPTNKTKAFGDTSGQMKNIEEL